MDSLDLLIKNLSKLPGVGKKSASRIAYSLLNSSMGFNETLGLEIMEIQSKIKKCSICGNYSESEICEICASFNRDKSLLCIVEQPQDIQTIESTGDYRGLFHVLGGVLAPLDGIGPEELNLLKLVERVKKENIQEIIIATNPTLEGDSTALYIAHILKDSDISITRIASGLPVGGDFEYADKLSISRAFRGRRELI
ncbi:MAG: recombination protein RecR [Spirochaetaceae bacterium]|nr:recombination protein RecR [Spirochaetaceae bacterium]